MLSLQSAITVQSTITRLFLKKMGSKHKAYHIINTDPGHTHSKEQLDQTLKITFASLPKSTDKKKKEKKKKRKAIAKCYMLHANAKIVLLAVLLNSDLNFSFYCNHIPCIIIARQCYYMAKLPQN